MRRTPAVVIVALLLAAALPASAADIPEDCTSGPVSQASAAAPLVVDSAGDLTNYGAVHQNRVDLRAAWVGVGQPAAEGTPQYTMNIQVADLLIHPVNATYYIVYTGARGAQFAAAQGYPDGSFRFRYGNIGTSVTGGRLYDQTATATGSSNAANGVISINVPASELPAPSADGSAVKLDVSEVTSNIIVGSPERLPTPDGAPKQGFVYAADDVTNGDICDAVLHEAVTSEG
jgi:hypothetical protein